MYRYLATIGKSFRLNGRCFIYLSADFASFVKYLARSSSSIDLKNLPIYFLNIKVLPIPSNSIYFVDRNFLIKNLPPKHLLTCSDLKKPLFFDELTLTDNDNYNYDQLNSSSISILNTTNTTSSLKARAKFNHISSLNHIKSLVNSKLYTHCPQLSYITNSKGYNHHLYHDLYLCKVISNDLHPIGQIVNLKNYHASDIISIKPKDQSLKNHYYALPLVNDYFYISTTSIKTKKTLYAKLTFDQISAFLLKE